MCWHSTGDSTERKGMTRKKQKSSFTGLQCHLRHNPSFNWLPVLHLRWATETLREGKSDVKLKMREGFGRVGSRFRVAAFKWLNLEGTSFNQPTSHTNSEFHRKFKHTSLCQCKYIVWYQSSEQGHTKLPKWMIYYSMAKNISRLCNSKFGHIILPNVQKEISLLSTMPLLNSIIPEIMQRNTNLVKHQSSRKCFNLQ